MTRGTQPAAVMAFNVFIYTGHHLSEDDINGIVWLYKVTYEDLDPGDCFFPDYTFEKVPAGCVPKSPLIFELRQGHETFAVWILEQDRNIDVNARDDTGSTALHYAVLNRYTEVVDALLSHENIWIRPRNKADKSPIDLARDLGDEKMVKLLSEHPNQHLSVAAKGKLATTWASLKQRQ